MTKSKVCELEGLTNCDVERHWVDERSIKIGRYEIRELEYCDGSERVSINGKWCKPGTTYRDAVSACFHEQAAKNAARKVIA